MYELLKAGAFGNTIPIYSPFEALALYTDPPPAGVMESSEGVWTVRTRSKPGTQLPDYSVPVRGFLKLAMLIHSWRTEYKVDVNDIMISPNPPDDKIAIQGELMRTPLGLHFKYNCTPNKSLRRAMDEFTEDGDRAGYATGLTAKMLLQQNLTPSSYADLEAVLDQYPDHVVELTAWAVEVGNIPGRNTCVWEVRLY